MAPDQCDQLIALNPFRGEIPQYSVLIVVAYLPQINHEPRNSGSVGPRYARYAPDRIPFDQIREHATLFFEAEPIHLNQKAQMMSDRSTKNREKIAYIVQ